MNFSGFSGCTVYPGLINPCLFHEGGTPKTDDLLFKVRPPQWNRQGVYESGVNITGYMIANDFELDGTYFTANSLMRNLLVQSCISHKLPR